MGLEFYHQSPVSAAAIYPGLTRANWIEAPYNRWTYNNAPLLFNGYRLDKSTFGNKLSGPFAQGYLDDFLFFDYNHEQYLQAGDYLTESCTDAIIAVNKDGVIFEHYPGPYADRAQPHMLQSTSKSCTGLHALQLIEEGLLDEKRYVGDYLPFLRETAYSDATLRDVLNMTVSLNFREDYEVETTLYKLSQYVCGFYECPVSSGLPEVHTIRDFLTILDKGPQPHSREFLYASPNYFLLPMIIESVTQQRFAETFHKWLWEPLGMENDGFLITDVNGHAVGDGGFCMTARDFARIAMMMLNNGRTQRGEKLFSAGLFETLLRRDQATYMGFHGWHYTCGFISRESVLAHVGINGQVFYVDFTAGTAVIKLSSQPETYDPSFIDNDVCLCMAICDAQAQRQTDSYCIGL